MKSVIVSAAEIAATPGYTLDASYWMPVSEGGHKAGETATAWRKRLRREASVQAVQERVAQLGGIEDHDSFCDACLGSGLVYVPGEGNLTAGQFTLCTAPPAGDDT